MNELMFRDPFANMFGSIRAMMDDAFGSQVHDTGLKKLIRRPHNLITKKDKDGNVVGFILEVVYTPFKKSEVSAKVKDGQIVVKCGTENKYMNDDEVVNYQGISYQSYQFTLPLTDDVDTTAIAAKAEDGLLRIDIPMKKLNKVETDGTDILIV